MSYSGFKLSVVLTLGFLLANSTACPANGNILPGEDRLPAATAKYDPVPGQDDKKAVLLQASLDSLTASGVVPGAVLCILLPGGTSVSLASGLADKETKTPMQPSDRMFGGSTGKTFVAAIIMKLVREKKIRLDDKVSKYFGGQAWFSALPNASLITVKMLLNHTSGLPPYEYGSWGGQKGVPGSIEETSLAVSALSASFPENCRLGLEWLDREFHANGLTPRPIGLHFASLWYHEKMYPLVFYFEALARITEQQNRLQVP